MTLKTYLGLFCTGALVGIVLFAFFEGWITVHIPQHFFASPSPVTHEKSKNITLLYWTPVGWQNEQTTILESTYTEKVVEKILTALFCTLCEAQLLKKQIKVQAVMINNGGHELFISLDHVPFNKEASIFTKWMYIESILKTLKNNGIKTPLVRVLVNHQPIHDRHLDLATSWPINGFLT